MNITIPQRQPTHRSCVVWSSDRSHYGIVVDIEHHEDYALLDVVWPHTFGNGQGTRSRINTRQTVEEPNGDYRQII